MKKTTINYILEGTRLMIGCGIGLFVRGVYKTVTADKSKPAKIGYWLSGLAATWAIAHAADNWVDTKAKVAFGILEPDGSLTDKFMNEIMNNE